jgi:hypothetical protein
VIDKCNHGKTPNAERNTSRVPRYEFQIGVVALKKWFRWVWSRCRK